MYDCTVSDNVGPAWTAGMVIIDPGSEIVLERSKFRSNDGIAITNFSSDLHMQHCEVSESAATGLENHGNTSERSITINNSLFYDNGDPSLQSYTGSAILNSNGGGGNDDIVLTVKNSTFFKNESDLAGAGIRSTGPVQVSIQNSILWGNEDSQGGTVDESDQFSGGSVSVTYSDVQRVSGVTSGTGNINADPLLTTTGAIGRTQDGSPCRDAGSNTGITWGLDLDGNFRTVNSTVDMGVNELPCDYGTCRCDFDTNATVNAADRGFVSTNLGCTLSGDCSGCDRYDLDNNGVVNAADRGIVSANYGSCPQACQ